MTHEETIKRIQELTGGMALEFGCEVINQDEWLDWAKRIAFITRNPKNGLVYFREQDGSLFSTRGLKNIEILGKPITLSVIFQAIHATMISPEKQEKSHHLIDYSVEAEGGVYPPLWNLSKDNFNDQSEETKSFIGGLIN